MAGPWRVMIELAQRRCDAAARALAGEHSAQTAVRARGALLEQYRADTLARIDAATREGIAGGALRELRRFAARLERGRAQQQRDEAEGAARVEQANSAWSAARRKLEAFAALRRRREAAANARAQRAEQRMHDETAARRARATSQGEIE
jgi:flagellar export protein FliJ